MRKNPRHGVVPSPLHLLKVGGGGGGGGD
ncbi:unnamed protein product [Spirodela intermedia]|uniref:Uncharacterized protein n=1 Tax=Spirodela intermedia TaxID=51605 RepID=A0A7I8KZG1_SPIIN|nr:unnamed protein product [Spirodela intermedia]